MGAYDPPAGEVFSAESVAAYSDAAANERARVEQRLRGAQRRIVDAEELLRRLDALAGGSSGPDHRAGALEAR